MKKIILLALAMSVLSSLSFAAKPKPDHVLFMVFDQMRPDYVDRYDLKNFKRLRAMGLNYVNSYVGHSASVTVVSHAVMSTGLLPKELPWQDDVVWDHNGYFGKKDLLYNTTRLTQEQLLSGLKMLDQNQFLATHLKKLGGQVIAIGEKNYAAIAMGGPYADRLITIEKKNGKCLPSGVNVPTYISGNDRFQLECSNDFGTTESFYPLDGNRFYPGTDEKHLGGDVWTGDAALAVMKNEKWSALFLTFGAIDRIGHMTGEADKKLPHAFKTPIDLEQACRTADAQVGRLLDELAAEKLLDKTLIISTADHGGQTDLKYFGNGQGEILGHVENSEDDVLPFWPQRLAKTGLIRLGCFDTGFRLWLKDPSQKNVDEVLRFAEEISGLTHAFVFDHEKKTYREIYKDFLSVNTRFQAWANQHDLELANTMASTTGPDIILFFEDNVGFDRIGDHGGAQEKVQRIPMMIYDPAGGAKGQTTKPLRLVDLKTLILIKTGLN
jgi:Type I phosphodiesterase / nucleotide pyrophosphatase